MWELGKFGSKRTAFPKSDLDKKCVILRRNLRWELCSVGYYSFVNRWFLAVTLLHNPSFIKYRRRGRHFTASVVTLGSINFDVPLKNFETNSEGRPLFFLYCSLFCRSLIVWGKGLPRFLPQYNTVCIWVLLLSFLVFFCILNFFESKCYFPNKSYSKLWAKLY